MRKKNVIETVLISTCTYPLYGYNNRNTIIDIFLMSMYECDYPCTLNINIDRYTTIHNKVHWV